MRIPVPACSKATQLIHADEYFFKKNGRVTAPQKKKAAGTSPSAF
jgi:hypothetical protein